MGLEKGTAKVVHAGEGQVRGKEERSRRACWRNEDKGRPVEEGMKTFSNAGYKHSVI